MACNWFYNTSPEKPQTYASDTIARSLLRNKSPGRKGSSNSKPKTASTVSELNEDQLYMTLSNYLAPENGTCVNGKVITPEVLKRTQDDQIRKFRKRYKEIRSNAVDALAKVRANASKHSPEDVNQDIERITQQFIQQTKEALRKLLQMLCIAEEKYRISLDNPQQGNTSIRVLEITQKQVESLVGHKIKVPDEYVRAEVDEDLNSFVASIASGPEEYFANVLLEDLKNVLQAPQSNGRLPRSLSSK
ncbi:hypothetical protein Aperf_G00000122652 [Anoplocephala perfoliata]